MKRLSLTRKVQEKKRQRVVKRKVMVGEVDEKDC